MPAFDAIHDDGSHITYVAPVEEGPRSGVWVDSEEFIRNPTEEEKERGRLMGEVIDIHDDYDNGGIEVVQ